MIRSSYICVVAMASMAFGCGGNPQQENTGETSEDLAATDNRDGTAETFHTSGAIDATNPFFLPLGINNRSCASCHDASAAWTVTPKFVRSLFEQTGGTAPIFSTVDATTRPDADVSTVHARREAYNLLLSKGLIRFTRTASAAADFTVDAVDDPYGWSTTKVFSNFRRVPSAANLLHSSSITWNGSAGDTRLKIMGVVNGGAKFHMQRPNDVPIEQQQAAADFLLGLSFAQSIDSRAGALDIDGARGGPTLFSSEPYYTGVNALGGDSMTGAPFDNESFKVFDAWEGSSGGRGHEERARNKARAKIASGEHIFYTQQFDIRGVAGLNDAPGQEVVRGTCTTCHNAPNSGNHSEFRLMNTGIADALRRPCDVPLITVHNNATGETLQTSDLGRGFSTGKFVDIGKFKVPNLRGVGSRAPYFHDGSGRHLRDVVDFYKSRFGIDFDGHEEDLIAFLEAI